MTDALRLGAPVLLALVSALAMDRLTAVRGLLPPGFRIPWRRSLGAAVVAFALWVGVFLSIGQIGLPRQMDLAGLNPLELFLLHGVLVATLVAWLALAHAGVPVRGEGDVASQLGLRARSPAKEALIGFGAGVLTWPLLLLVVGFVLVVLVAAGAEDLVPDEAPELVVWIAALPVGWKLAIAASAGLVEESFFRGFLQPRVGIGLSSLLFVAAHLSYDQPFMLVGITMLSFLFAGLVWWRQNIWAAVVAHFLFDAVQLLFVIPWALRESGGAGFQGVAGLF